MNLTMTRSEYDRLEYRDYLTSDPALGRPYRIAGEDRTIVKARPHRPDGPGAARWAWDAFAVTIIEDVAASASTPRPQEP